MTERFDWLQRYGDLIMDPPPLLAPLQPTVAAQAFYRLAYNKEDNDCGVRALAVACAAPYVESHAAFKRIGRADSGPTSPEMVLKAMPLLGYEAVEIWLLTRSITVQACGRELAGCEGGYVIVTCNHALGVWDGEVIDWDRDSKQRVCGVFEARRIEQ